MRNKRWVLGVMLAAVAALHACGSRKSTISDKGLHYAKLGDEMPPAGARRYKGFMMRDTLETEGEFSWQAASLHYKVGRVVLEEDFRGEGGVNRIRIETPELSLRNGLHVGMTVKDLRECAIEWFVSPLPEFRVFDFYSWSFPGIHFIVDDPKRSMEDTNWESYTLDSFDSSAVIRAIVVM